MTWPGEGLLIKLWETLAEKGIGGLLKPWHIKREALAHTQARQIELVGLADAEREADEIRSGRLKLSDSRYALALPTAKSRDTKEPKSIVEPHRAVEVATTVIVADALRREVNVAKAITYAESTLKDDPQKPPDRNVDSDWLYRWRDAAGAVSSEELQSVWGRLLAGELKSPGSYSYRTLDFVRNLTTDEAKNIEHVSQFVIDDFVSRQHQTLLDENGISFGYLLGLQNLGLLSGVDSVGLNMTLGSTQKDRFLRLLRSHGRALVVTHDDPTKELKLKVYTLTSLGTQVLRLGKFHPNEQYLRAIGEDLKTQGMAVAIGSYQTVSEQSVRLFDAQPL